MPKDWDHTILYTSLQEVRCDPSAAHGYAPAEMLLGRQLVYPIELKKKAVDFTGTKMTQPLVEALIGIHNNVFGIAAERIGKFQKRYKKKFDKRHRVQKFTLKKGSKVQVKLHKNKRSKSNFGRVKWIPSRGYYLIHKVNRTKRNVTLKTRDGRVLKYSRPFERIRKFNGI